MNEDEGRAAIEPVIRAGLTRPFEEAVNAGHSARVFEVLVQAGLSQNEAVRAIHWLFTSPYSVFNKTRLELAPEIEDDSRVKALPVPDQRIIQHLCEQHGGSGPETCLKNGCNQHALNGLAFCAYCAHTLANPPPEGL